MTSNGLGGGTDGVRVATEKTDDSGYWLHHGIKTPDGWAAYYKGAGRLEGRLALHVQNY